jgi:hypothetical protein
VRSHKLQVCLEKKKNAVDSVESHASEPSRAYAQDNIDTKIEKPGGAEDVCAALARTQNFQFASRSFEIMQFQNEGKYGRVTQSHQNEHRFNISCTENPKTTAISKVEKKKADKCLIVCHDPMPDHRMFTIFLDFSRFQKELGFACRDPRIIQTEKSMHNFILKEIKNRSMHLYRGTVSSLMQLF